MAFSVVIGGTDITGYIASDGFKWERNDIDSPNSGRDANGKMHRRIVARKDKLQVTCRPLKRRELYVVLGALDGQTVQVTYKLPGASGMETRTATFYNSRKSAGLVQDIGPDVIYADVTFDLIEV